MKSLAFIGTGSFELCCVNSLWNVTALKQLYKGSLHDMWYYTPDIGLLSCLFVVL